jgi:hypothetical protein
MTWDVIGMSTASRICHACKERMCMSVWDSAASGMSGQFRGSVGEPASGMAIIIPSLVSRRMRLFCYFPRNSCGKSGRIPKGFGCLAAESGRNTQFSGKFDIL